MLLVYEPSLVVIPYSGGATSNKNFPFANKCSTISSSYKYQIYIDHLSIRNGTPTTVKLFVGQDMSSAVFGSLELVQRADELKGAVRVCFIQASKVVVAGYLNGSTKTMNVTHGTKRYNCLPHMRSMDIEVKMLNIKDPERRTPNVEFQKPYHGCLHFMLLEISSLLPSYSM